MKDSNKRVVVTGMGIISCLGKDINSVSKSLQNGIAGYDVNPETGIIFGHDSVAQPTVEMAFELMKSKETKMLGSGYIFQIMNSTVTMNLGTIFNTKGANWTIAAACSSGSHSIGQASELIKNGHQERIIAGGAQEINWHSMASFDALGAFS